MFEPSLTLIKAQSPDALERSATSLSSVLYRFIWLHGLMWFVSYVIQFVYHNVTKLWNNCNAVPIWKIKLYWRRYNCLNLEALYQSLPNEYTVLIHYLKKCSMFLKCLMQNKQTNATKGWINQHDIPFICLSC